MQATLAEKPDDVQVAAATTGDKAQAQKPTEISGLGLKLAPITQETKDKFSLGADQKGVVITDVAPNSSAAERGLKAGDVIVEVQQGEVVVAGRGAEEGGHRAQGEPQVGADADPAPGRPAVGAAVAFGRQGQAAGMSAWRRA